MTASPEDHRPHPYIPNAIPAVRAEMLATLGVRSVDDYFADIPPSLRLDGPMDLPPPLRSEAELVRHVEELLARNRSTRELISFLGAGCYGHHVPAVCDEINGRAEFLTAYAGEPYEDHGRFQALFEYCSMMGELLLMDVVNVPVYDGFQATATAARMAARLTGRRFVLVPATMGRDKLSRLTDYLRPDLAIEEVAPDPATGELSIEALRAALCDDTAAVVYENPSYLGVVETGAAEICRLAHEAGALAIGSVDPSTLGVLAPPASAGADIACGDIQTLGMHQHFGGGHAGFIASHDDPRVVAEFPSRLFGITPTAVEGEYGFGDVFYERTSFARREEGKEWVGTAAALWGITAGVYLALMGPAGMRELNETQMARTRYAMTRLAAIPGVRVPYAGSHHVKEFVVDLSTSGRTVSDASRALLERGILAGKDLSVEHPWLGQSLLVAVTELTTKADIDRLADSLAEVLA